MTKDCLFCKIYKEKSGIIYENINFYSRFDAVPVSPGHCEVIPKRHVVSLIDLTEEEWATFKPAIKDTIQVIEFTDLKKLYQDYIKNPPIPKSVWFAKQMLKHPGINKKPDAYNHGNNDGEAAGRTIHHLHWHIIPRYKGDVKDPRGGIRYIIPDLANYKVLGE